MLTWKLLAKCKLLQDMLVVFSFVSSLMYSLCCQNTQYLSFRTVVQLLASTATTTGEVANIVGCLLVLFLTLALAVAMPVFLKRKVLAPMFGHLNPRHPSFHCYLSLSFLRSFALGFCHAYLNSNCPLQLTVILAIENLLILIIVTLRHAFLSKLVLLFTLVKQVLRAVLSSVLLFEYNISETESIAETASFAVLELTIIGGVLVTAVL